MADFTIIFFDICLIFYRIIAILIVLFRFSSRSDSTNALLCSTLDVVIFRDFLETPADAVRKLVELFRNVYITQK